MRPTDGSAPEVALEHDGVRPAWSIVHGIAPSWASDGMVLIPRGAGSGDATLLALTGGK